MLFNRIDQLRIDPARCDSEIVRKAVQRRGGRHSFPVGWGDHVKPPDAFVTQIGNGMVCVIGAA